MFRYKFFSIFFCHKNPGPGWVFSLKFWIRTPWIRIHNTEKKHKTLTLHPWGHLCLDALELGKKVALSRILQESLHSLAAEHCTWRGESAQVRKNAAKKRSNMQTSVQKRIKKGCISVPDADPNHFGLSNLDPAP
jgi:hypothetical protein